MPPRRSSPKASSPTGASRPHFEALAGDLLAHKGRSVVAAGPSQPAAVHAAAHRLNALLENAGRTVLYTEEPDPERLSHVEAIRTLAAAMGRGNVKTLLILGGNPVYDAPADVDFAGGLAKVENSIHLALYRNETSRRCRFHLPRAHALEAWADARAYDGTVTIAQPLIQPLYGGRSPLELLALLLGDEQTNSLAIVRETFGALHGEGDLETAWRRAVHQGFVPGSGAPEVRPAIRPAGAPAAFRERALEAGEPANGELEVTFHADPCVHDGRFANNAWLQELPEFMTKLTWGNAALFAPATARALGVEDGTLVRLRLGGRTVESAASVMPGQAPGSVALFIGYGRRAAGSVGGSERGGVAPVGFDVYPLRTSEGMEFAAGLEVEATGRRTVLATTQNHYAIDKAGLEERGARIGALVREAPLARFKEHPDFAKHEGHEPKPLQLYASPVSEAGHRWGMAVDLGSCVGCNACIVACQAENNVPVAGKDQVNRGRAMQWIRVDRYFAGPPEAPAVAMQPVLCQHCENAPCEQVCPVAATQHSTEGLNEQVYNRCIGTRYCANNCPYKVRRFNWLDFHRAVKAPDGEVLKLLYNPDVTVRDRGVMEKCTFCIQRIQSAKIHARNERRPIADGEIVPACAQVCPAEAIVFGDLADPGSAVSRLHASPRAYGLLAELNLKPRLAYLAKVRNPHPDLAGAAGGGSGAEGGASHG